MDQQAAGRCCANDQAGREPQKMLVQDLHDAYPWGSRNCDRKRFRCVDSTAGTDRITP